MKSKPLISVIVPIYNVELYLPRCIKSIVDQTYDNLEIILVNDGSTDRCADICKQFAASDNRIRIINKDNGGLSDARNAGIDAAHGSYIGFVDSDDWIKEDMYEYLLDGLTKHQADISICEYYNVWPRYSDATTRVADRVFRGEAIVRSLLMLKLETMPGISYTERSYGIRAYDIRWGKSTKT